VAGEWLRLWPSSAAARRPDDDDSCAGDIGNRSNGRCKQGRAGENEGHTYGGASGVNFGRPARRLVLARGGRVEWRGRDGAGQRR